LSQQIPQVQGFSELILGDCQIYIPHSFLLIPFLSGFSSEDWSYACMHGKRNFREVSLTIASAGHS